MVRPYAAGDRYLLLRDACEFIGLLDGVGRRDQVAVVRLERWQRARGDDDVAGHGRVVFSTGHANTESLSSCRGRSGRVSPRGLLHIARTVCLCRESFRSPTTARRAGRAAGVLFDALVPLAIGLAILGLLILVFFLGSSAPTD